LPRFVGAAQLVLAPASLAGADARDSGAQAGRQLPTGPPQNWSFAMATETGTFKKGDRVEWRDQRSNQKRQGTIQQVEGSGQNSRYTIRDDQNKQQQEEVQHNWIDKKLQ
jgi:hypothetical protein